MAAIEEEPVTRQTRTEDSTYVIQVKAEVNANVTGGGADLKQAWFDIATVTVPARTKRKRVIREGLKKAGITPHDDPIEVRALNEESAHVLTVGLETPEPQLRIA